MELPKSAINQLFDNLNAWRHLPDYQLERRADIFFSIYLRAILAKNLKIQAHHDFIVIPEFPIKQSDSRRSDKVDFAVFVIDKYSIVMSALVELKTDAKSINLKQLGNYARGKLKSIRRLIDDVEVVSEGSKERVKYSHLIEAVRKLKNMHLDSNHKTQVIYILPAMLADNGHNSELIKMANQIVNHWITFQDIIMSLLKVAPSP